MEQTENLPIPLRVFVSSSPGYYRFTLDVNTSGKAIANPDRNNPFYAFVVLNRHKPDDVVAKAFTKDATSVPSDDMKLLDRDHLLVFGFCGSVTRVPQGDLYNVLMRHGGGSKLRALEAWCTRFTCGTYSNYSYALVSAPGTGLMGAESLMAEKLDPPMTVELMRGMDGFYTPHQLT